MEFVDGGELFHYVDERKGLPEDEVIYIFRQIVSALLYCHRLRICHRDLKPENILLNQKDLTVKLIDFGMAALQPEGSTLARLHWQLSIKFSPSASRPGVAPITQTTTIAKFSSRCASDIAPAHQQRYSDLVIISSDRASTDSPDCDAADLLRHPGVGAAA